MADEEQGWGQRIGAAFSAPFQRVASSAREGMGEWRRNPGQELIQRFAGLAGAATGIPGFGSLLSNRVDRHYDNANYRANYVHRSPEERGSQFGALGDLLGLPDYTAGNPGTQQPGQPAQSSGPGGSAASGTSPGMPGITSPWSGQPAFNSQLGSLLGIPNYAQPQAQPPQQGMPGITSPLPPGMGAAAPSSYMGWAQAGVRPVIGTGTGPNPFNVVGRTDRFSDAAQ